MGAGQSQSTGEENDLTGEPSNTGTSYYDLLGVEHGATDDEIKKAYRRKALELHPDRNFGDVERTTKLFADVQTAYEVLSDPQERAWYDAHENAILGGDNPQDDLNYEQQEHNIGLTTAADINKLFRRFNANIEFSDGPNGFFGFLRQTFETLAKEEELAARRSGAECPDYLSFGHRDDDYADVVKPFYASWSSFSTKKTFAWRDKYRLSDAPDRRIRRLMEKENKTNREHGIHEFNESVRSLLAFVRKRDPRVELNTQSEAERQKALREATAAQAARMRAANAARAADKVPDWAIPQEHEKDELEGSLGEEEESDEEHFECVACRKTFKSEKQFESHEKSKKHLKAVEALKRQLRKEGVELDIDDENDEEVDPTIQHDQSSHEFGTGLHQQEPSIETLADDTTNLHLAEKDESGDGSSDSEDADNDITDSIVSETSLGQHDETAPPKFNGDEQGSKDQAPKIGKAAQKRAKKAAKATELTHKCATCNAMFASRTDMFRHIKDSKHEAPVPAVKGKAGKGKKKK